MNERLGTIVRVGVGLVVSAVCLWLAVRQAPLDDLMDALRQVNYWWIVPAVVANIASFIPRGYRWRVLLSDRGTAAEYFWAQSVGSLLTNLFPLRAGEVGRMMIISRRVGLPLVQVGASLVLERAADMIVVLGLLAALLLIMDVPWPIAASGLAVAVVLGLALVGIAALTVFGQQLTPLAQMVAQRLPGRLNVVLLAAWRNVLVALQPLRNLRVVLKVAFWSILTWLLLIVPTWMSIEATVPGARLIEATFALTAIAIGISLPSSPGFIGVLQLVGQQALVTPFPERFTPASALTVTLVFHAASYIASTLLGVIGLARLGLSLRVVREAPTTTEPSAP